MNERIKLNRRQFLILSTSVGLISCTPSERPPLPTSTFFTPTATIAPTPTQRPTETPAPTVPRPTETPRPVPTTPRPTPTEAVSEHDLSIRNRLQRARESETLDLSDVLIGDIIRTPWVDGSAVIVTLNSQQQNRFRTEAVILSSDCILDAFSRNNKLPQSRVAGHWRPRTRLDQINAEVVSSYSTITPKPILNAISIVDNGMQLNCNEERALDQLKDFVKSINWDEIPENVGEFIGTASRRFLEGLRRGLQTPTPIRR